ncbi:MAG: hypothetical protein KDB68_10625 [Planctomycetes bacterium]|nr:hypothetical protein [Planctomycetota bacterium]
MSRQPNIERTMDPELKIEQQASGRWAIVKETMYGERQVLEEHDTVQDAQTSQRLPKIS